MNTILVWYLVVGGVLHSGLATQLGPYADKDSCERVQQSIPIIEVTRERPHTFRNKSQCVQVTIPGVSK